MTDVAHLELKVTSTGVDTATRNLGQLGVASDGVTKRVANLKGMLAGTFLGVSISGGILAIVKSTIEAENAQKQLENRLRSTGNQVRMTKEELLDLATSLQGVTVFDDEAITNAESLLLTFTRVGREVFPQALESILNVSKALGTDLNSATIQVGKALNDPLKGITALARAGIQFTVGQKATIKSFMEQGKVVEAQKVILKELETQMGGTARAARDTLGGSLTGLKNDFMNLLEGDTGTEGVKGTRKAIEDLATKMRDPKTKEAFQGITQGVLGLAGAFVTVSTAAAEAWDDMQRWVTMKLGGANQAGDLKQIRYEMTSLQDNLDEMDSFPGWKKVLAAPDIKATKDRLAELKKIEQDHLDLFGEDKKPTAPTPPPATGTGTGVVDTSGILGEDGEDGPASKAEKLAERARQQRLADYADLKASLQTEEEAIQSSYLEREAIITASAKKGSAEELMLRQRSAAQRDLELEEAKERKGAELAQLKESLLTEEEAIQLSYERRKAIVLANTTAGPEQAALLAKLQAQRDLEMAFEEQSKQQKYDRLMAEGLEGMALELEMIRQNHQARQEEQRIAYEQELISKEEFERNKAAIEKQYHDQSQALLRDQQMQTMDAYGDMFGALGNLAGQFAKGQGKSAERMFKIQKALNLAQAIMSTATGIMRAQELGYPASIPATAMVVATGAAQVASIQSQKFSGAYDDGGRIPAGKFGVTGEKGMEIVEGPANVTSRRDTARLLRKASEGGDASGPVSVIIEVNVDNRGNASSETKTEGEDAQNAKELGKLIDVRVRDVILREQRQGGLLRK